MGKSASRTSGQEKSEVNIKNECLQEMVYDEKGNRNTNLEGESNSKGKGKMVKGYQNQWAQTKNIEVTKQDMEQQEEQ